MGSSIVVLVLVALLSFILLLLADHYYSDQQLGKMTFVMLAFAFTTSYFLIKAIPRTVHWIT